MSWESWLVLTDCNPVEGADFIMRNSKQLERDKGNAEEGVLRGAYWKNDSSSHLALVQPQTKCMDRGSAGS